MGWDNKKVVGCRVQIDSPTPKKFRQVATDLGSSVSTQEFHELEWVTEEFEMVIPPSCLSWKIPWEFEEGLPVVLYKESPHSSKAVRQYLQTFSRNIGEFDSECSVIWDDYSQVKIAFEFRNTVDNLQDGNFRVITSLPMQRRLTQQETQHHQRVFSAVADGLGMKKQIKIDCDTQEITFSPGTLETANGELFGIHDFPTSMFGIRRIQNCSDAAAFFETFLEAVIGVTGAPFCVQMRLSGSPNSASKLTKHCESISALWRLECDALFPMNYDPFKKPRGIAEKVVLPVFMCRDISQRYNDYIGLALYAEYINDSSNLLVFTNHNSQWMNQVLSDANVLEFAKPLKRQEIYPGI
ncbi:hypothetical protein [Stieleria mannarensis]|uniref:hypothetical protein n=1 Tax=Stieleria mannarensis TaxID=2755585 RepID=UPI0016043A68|nr:hypothetical protein [Rhodopirellula sp. JC639]